MERYARLFADHRGLVLFFVVAVSALAVFGLTRLEFDDVARGIFASDDAEYRRLQSVYDDFGSDDNDALLVLEADDWFEPEASAILVEVAARLHGLPDTERVVGPTEVPVFDERGARQALFAKPDATESERNAARERALAHPLVGGVLLSMDGTTAFFAVRQQGGALRVEEMRPFVEALDRICADVSERQGLVATQTGVPKVRVEIYDTIRTEQVFFLLLSSGLCFLLAWWLFRNLGACLVACLPPLVASAWTLGFVGLLGYRIDLLGTVLPLLVIVISFTDCVHLVLDVRTSRAAGIGPKEAAAEAIRHVGLPCLLTSLTTAVGFGSLALGNVEIVRRFGFLAAISVTLAFCAVITSLPLLSSVFADLGGQRPKERAPGKSGWIESILRHSRAVTLAGFGGIALFAYLATSLVPENRLTEALPRDNASFAALQRAERAFRGVLPAHVLVEWDESMDFADPELRAVLDEVEAIFEADETTGRPVSILGLLASLPGPLAGSHTALGLLPEDVVARYLRPDLRRALVSVGVPDGGSEVMVPLFERMRGSLQEIEKRHGGVRLFLTGTDVVARSNVNRMIEGLARSLAFAAFVIFGVIALEFGSLRLGLISLVPNLLPLFVVSAVLVLTGRPLQMASAVVFTILLGLAVDDTIHFLARYRREQREGNSDPLPRTSRVVGRAICFTTLVLGAAHLLLLLSRVETTRLTGGLVTIGLGAALVGDLILLPALLHVFQGRKA